MFTKIRFLIFCITLLILGTTSIMWGYEDVDTIVLANHKRIVINIRKVDFKNDLIKVPIVENDQEFIYNYLPVDIDHIATNDSVYVSMVYKKHPDIRHLFIYWNSGKMYLYEDLYAKSFAEDVVSKKKVKQNHQRKDTLSQRQLVKSLPDTSILNNPIDFKWALKAGTTFIYNISASETFTYQSSIATGTISSQKNVNLSFDNYFISLIRADKRKNIHEFEMGLLRYNSVDKFTSQTRDSDNRTIITSGSKVNTFSFGLAYHYQYTFLKRKKTRFLPFIEFTANPTYQNTHSEPKISTSYSTSTNTIGLNLFVAPGLYYFFSKKVFLSASLPINFFYHNHSILRVENPNMPTRLQLSSSDYSQLFPFTSWYLKLSIGFKL